MKVKFNPDAFEYQCPECHAVVSGFKSALVLQPAIENVDFYADCTCQCRIFITVRNHQPSISYTPPFTAELLRKRLKMGNSPQPNGRVYISQQSPHDFE